MSGTVAEEATVIIVGAGAAGCTLALQLASHGIPSILLERRSAPLVHPAAHVISARSHEIWHQASPELAGKVAKLGVPMELIGPIRWCTEVTGELLGEINLFEDPERVARVPGFSRYVVAHIGQHQLTPTLWSAVEQEPAIRFMRGVQVRSLDDITGRPIVRVMDATGTEHTLRARYVAACDGAQSTVRASLGVGMEGPVLANMASVFFHADLDAVLPKPRPLISWIYNPSFAGVLIAHANDEYVLMTAFFSPDQEVARNGAAYWRRAVPAALGVPDFAFTVRSLGTWQMTTQMADRFRSGNVFLVGDAAHRFPHTGGFGLNSGVQDAQNLAWKLAAVLHGRANERILDTYEEERRPAIKLFADQSTGNHFKLDRVTESLGLTNRLIQRMTQAFTTAPLKWLPPRARGQLGDALLALGLARTRMLRGQSKRAQALRREIRARIAEQLEHFISTGLEFGYAYRGGLVLNEAESQPLLGGGVVDYRPTTWPGARLPHAWLQRDGAPFSVHDLLSQRSLTLLTLDARAWTHALGDESAMRVPVEVASVDATSSAERAALAALFEVGERGALLVRPDGHVAWRTSRPAAEGGADALYAALRFLSPYFVAGDTIHPPTLADARRARSDAAPWN
jgi:2,4-dichlorophenol 6-monooxygenase